MFVDPKVIDYFTKEVILVKTDAEKDTLTARAYHVSGYPTLVLVDKAGKEIDRIVGYLPPEELMKTVTDYRNGIGTLEDLLNKSKQKPDRGLAFQIADKYKYRGGDTEAEIWYQKVIVAGQPTDSLSGESRMALADMYRRGKNYDRAIKAYQAIMTDFSGKPTAEGAEIYTAITLKSKGDTLGAIKAFQGFVEHFPKSEDVEYATKQIDKLKNPAPKPAESH